MPIVDIKKSCFVGLRPWIIWGCGAFFYCYQFIVRTCPNVMTDNLMEAFAIDATTLGVVAAAYYPAYAGMQIPLGVLLDRFGPRRLLAASGFICGSACFLFANAHSSSLAWVARFLMGVGSACGFIGTLKLGTLWFPPRLLGRVIGCTMIMGTLGATLAGAPLQYLIECVGWREALLILAGGGIILGILTYALVRDNPEPKPASEHEDTQEHPGMWASLKLVLSSTQAWAIALYGALMYVPVAVLGDLWGVSFIQKSYNIDGTLAAPVITAMFIGMAVGSPIFTFLSDYMAKRRFPMMLGALTSLVIHLLIIGLPQAPLPVMYGLFFLAGFFFTGQCLCFAAVCEIMPLSASGIALGFTNMVVMLSGVIFEPVVGWLLDFSKQQRGGMEALMYTETDFRLAFICIPASIMVAFFLMRQVKETYPHASS